MINNSGSLTTINSTFDLNRTINHSYYNDHFYVYGIYNTNNVNMTDGGIKIYDTSGATSPLTYYYGIRNVDSSTSNLDGISIDITGGKQTYNVLHESSSTTNVFKNIDFKAADVPTAYGIYIDTGTINVQTGNIETGVYVEEDEHGNKTYIDKNVDTAHGVYVNTLGSALVLGVKDTSDKSGTAEADVSITNPLIIAKGNTLGIGVKKYDGLFKFYDGIVMGNTYAKPDTTSETDHVNYAATTYYDDDIAYEYCVLEYVRDFENKHDWSASMNDVYYKTINAAINRSQEDDIIYMMRSLVQNIEVPSDKQVTIDLNKHILSGTITNNGTVTIINGEISTTGTSYTTAVTNNGTMYIGKDDGTIIDDYVTYLGNYRH